MIDVARVGMLLRSAFVPSPRIQRAEDVAAAAAAIDRMADEAKRINGMSRSSALDDMTEAR